MWEFALGDVPTHHLQECFIRAARSKENSYMILATEIRQQYTEMLPDLQRQAQEHAREQEHLLISGYGSLGYMSFEEWKARHNLPDEWHRGDPYPPESDLCGAPLPPKPEQVYRCATCKDAGWVKKYLEYVGARQYPKLMQCPDCTGY